MNLKALVLLVSLFLLSCNKTDLLSPLEEEQTMAGGETTHSLRNSFAFSTPAPNLTATQLDFHLSGDLAFGATFVTSPALLNGGLGPIFNQTSCIACHIKDGRGKPPVETSSDLGALLLRISMTGNTSNGDGLPVSGFGNQLQNRAIFGTSPEGKVSVSYVESIIRFIDGENVKLQKPVYGITNTYSKLPVDVLISPRIASPIFGLGLLEAIDESTIVKLADENDINKDGISGKPNYVWDFTKNKISLGRFGWKANQPNLFQQVAAAYNGDMGITSPLFPSENCHGQTNCISKAEIPEIDNETLKTTTFYTQTLGVPSRRNVKDAVVVKGKAIFSSIGCTGCHTEKLTSGNNELKELSNQTFSPYTDLLLHDMGEGLADNRPDFKATGNEWRTAPLWGIGLTEVVNGHTRFLHDGRARNLNEAILWHSGEGERAKTKYTNLSATDRKAVVKFLENL